MQQPVHVVRPSRRTKLARSIQKNWLLYVLLLPTLVYLLLFQYWPLYGDRKSVGRERVF